MSKIVLVKHSEYGQPTFRIIYTNEQESAVYIDTGKPEWQRNAGTQVWTPSYSRYGRRRLKRKQLVEKDPELRYLKEVQKLLKAGYIEVDPNFSLLFTPGHRCIQIQGSYSTAYEDMNLVVGGRSGHIDVGTIFETYTNTQDSSDFWNYGQVRLRIVSPLNLSTWNNWIRANETVNVQGRYLNARAYCVMPLPAVSNLPIELQNEGWKTYKAPRTSNRTRKIAATQLSLDNTANLFTDALFDDNGDI